MASPIFQKPKRSWQEIATEASVEKDPKKLQNLADELAKALDERDELGKAKSGWTLGRYTGRECWGRHITA
jgi:hypothetical protein